MQTQKPYEVALMDDDFSARKWNAAILTRHLQTMVINEASSPEGLLVKLAKEKQPD